MARSGVSAATLGSARRGICAVAALLAACGGAPAGSDGVRPPAAVARVGSSIAVLSSGLVAVVDPDQGSVSLVSPDTLEVTDTIPVGDTPRTLLELGDGHLLVAVHRSGEIVEVDPASARAVGRVASCAGAFGLAAYEDGTRVVASCEWEGRVVTVDLRSRSVETLAEGLVRPRPVLVQGDRVLVGEFTRGDVVELSPAGRRSISLVPADAPYRPALTEMTASLVSGLASSGSRVLVTHQLVNHTGNRTAEPVADDYGSVPDGNAKINPALTTLELGSEGFEAAALPALYAVFDGGPRAFSGPSAVTALGDHTALVVNEATADVAVVDLEVARPELRAVASFTVGSGAAGVAVDGTGEHAFVDEAFDGSVSRLDLAQARGADAPSHAPELTRARGQPSPYSDSALAGRRLFHDATDPHVTPSRVVACGSCHPEGGEDGLVWFIQTSAIPLKRRRTPDLYSSKTETAPFHWDGEFETMSDLTRHAVTDLMAGDAEGVDVDAVQAYVDEILAPPVLPVADPAAVRRGAATFDLRGCNECHAGKWFTTDELHVVLHPMTLDPDDAFTKSSVPGLRGVFLRAPYFHDGRSPTLEDSLLREDAGLHGGPEMTDAERSDLLAYVRSL